LTKPSRLWYYILVYQSLYIDRKTNAVHLWDDEHGYTSFKYRPHAYKKSRTGKYTSIYGDKLERIEKFNPRDSKLFESDVPLDTKVLIDAYHDSDEVSKNHRFTVLDIEVDSTGGYPDVKDPKQKITAIALYNGTKNVYHCFVLDEGGIVKNEVKNDQIITAYPTEENLLLAFLEKWDEIKPTICTGWNIDGFDFPYLHARLVRVVGEETANKLSPIEICYWNKYKNKMTIAGVNCLDYLLLYKKYSGKSLTNYRLDTVAKEELKIGKVEYEGSLDDLKKTDINKFIEYNLHDVILVKKMNDLLQFVELAQSICHVCHTGYEEFSVSSKILEGALLTYLRRKKLVAPNKKAVEESTDDDDDSNDDVGFEGAYVKDPIPGRYDWICSADINSLYPSVIMSLNISPETKVAVIKDWDSEKLVKKSEEKIVFDDEIYTYEDFGKLIEEYNLSVSANGVVYDQKKLGCVPDILKKWFAERVEFKNKMKECSDKGDKEGTTFWKRRQQVQKILLNSLYGVLGLPIFRFYDLDNAAAVTLTGQEIIKTSAKYVNSKFNKRCNTKDKDYVVYIDTDSLYLDINSLALHEKITDVKPFAIKTIGEVSDDLNKFYGIMMVKMFNSTDNRIKIASDVVASSAFWVVKKRYAMLKVYNMELNKDTNDIEIKGLDVVRSSYPKKFRDFMKGIITDILNGISNEDINSKIVEFKSKMSEFAIEDIAKNTSVKFISNTEAQTNFNPDNRDLFHFVDGSTAQCKAALAYNDMLKKYNLSETEPIMHGGKIKWVYLKDNPYGLDGMAFKDDGKDPRIVIDFIGNYIDRNRIWDAELEKKIADFYTAMRWQMYSENAAAIDAFFTF
jgi:DNA polymerase elongation subunit (family B)